MPAVRASGLAVSSASIAQICPAYGEPSRVGQWISGVRHVHAAGRAAGGGADAAFAAPPRLPVLVGLPRFQPQPDGQDGADVGEAAEGRAGWRGSPGRWLSSRRVSASTRPGRSLRCRSGRSRSCASGPRCRAAGPPARPAHSASKSYGAPYCSPHSMSPVMSRSASRTVPASARRNGRAVPAAAAAWHHVLSRRTGGPGRNLCFPAMPTFPAAGHRQAGLIPSVPHALNGTGGGRMVTLHQ